MASEPTRRDPRLAASRIDRSSAPSSLRRIPGLGDPWAAGDDDSADDSPGVPPGRTATETRPVSDTRTSLARRVRILVHNDDVTPMDFVVRVLTGVYRLGIEHAIEVMLEAHRSECALVKVLGLEEAEFRVLRSHALARSHGYPLTFSIEPE